MRIGAGAGFASDRIEPAVELAKSAALDFLVFECLAERTIALAHLRKRRGQAGYDPMLEARMRAVLPTCRQNGIRVITNMGAADPCGAMQATVQVARQLGLQGLTIAAVEGDDVSQHLDQLKAFDESPVLRQTTLSANAYLGAGPIVEALRAGADVVLCGRVADPSLFLAPMMYTFGWAEDDWTRLGRGISIGHLLECAAQLTGGYFADPPYKVVPGLDNLGFPFAQVDRDGSAVFSKLASAGGLLNLQTAREQLLYEVMDPARYVTPDVIADFTTIELEQVGKDTVLMKNAGGSARPLDYKVSLGVHNGFFGEGQISYAGGGAVDRAALARDVLATRLQKAGIEEVRFDLIGMDALHGRSSTGGGIPYEVRLRVVARVDEAAAAEMLMHEVESLYVNGPAGGSGVTTSMRESVAILPALLAREAVTTTVRLEVA